MIKEKFPDLPILFVCILDNQVSSNTESLTESEQHLLENGDEDIKSKKLTHVKNQLIRLGNSLILTIKSNVLIIGL